MLGFADVWLCFQLGALAWVFTNVLMKEGGILEWYYDLLVKLVNTRFKPLGYALGYCSECFCGQLALWTWLYMNFGRYKEEIVLTVLEHSIFIGISILFVSIIDKIR